MEIKIYEKELIAKCDFCSKITFYHGSHDYCVEQAVMEGWRRVEDKFFCSAECEALDRTKRKNVKKD